MNSEEFQQWKEKSHGDYAKEKESEGLSAEDAKAVADKSFRDLLPENERTPNQFLFTIREADSANTVGVLWFGLSKQGSKLLPWIYDIVIEEKMRGRGFGKLAMLAAEEEVKKLGYNRLGLHVFGHNKIAQSLYQSLGYATKNIVMQKELG